MIGKSKLDFKTRGPGFKICKCSHPAHFFLEEFVNVVISTAILLPLMSNRKLRKKRW